MDIQHNYECAAFSSAYVLRHLGMESDGNKLYKDYSRKLYDGTVTPKGIVLFFKRLGYDASFFCGNVDTLKKQVNLGIPVIAFIRVFPNQKDLHFVPVVGYDEEYFYLADSLEHTINCNETYYNRKVLIQDFEALWRTWVPFCKNTYIVIRQM
ncbi:C39 family peptidase [Paenibacillus sp. S-38]|uniref:C39 family peptidase n=1 Tax=Paenibacillus sp. S-38 TaxID=3416710 RepID=UPI003CE8E0EF